MRWACRPTVIGFVEVQVIFTSAEDNFKLQTFFIHCALSIIRHSMAPGLSGFSGVVASVGDVARYLVSRSGWMSSTATTQCFSSSTHPHRHFLEPSGLSYTSNRRHTSIEKKYPLWSTFLTTSLPVLLLCMLFSGFAQDTSLQLQAAKVARSSPPFACTRVHQWRCWFEFGVTFRGRGGGSGKVFPFCLASIKGPLLLVD